MSEVDSFEVKTVHEILCSYFSSHLLKLHENDNVSRSVPVLFVPIRLFLALPSFMRARQTVWAPVIEIPQTTFSLRPDGGETEATRKSSPHKGGPIPRPGIRSSSKRSHASEQPLPLPTSPVPCSRRFSRSVLSLPPPPPERPRPPTCASVAVAPSATSPRRRVSS